MTVTIFGHAELIIKIKDYPLVWNQITTIKKLLFIYSYQVYHKKL